MYCSVEELLEFWKSAPCDIFNKYQRVMVACSGHLDSTVLFHVLRDFSKRKKKFFLELLHVNFGLRENDSDLDQKFVENMAKKVIIPCHVFVVSEEELRKKKKEGLQDWAREIRYKFFLSHVTDNSLVALAHHQDDVAENIIFRLARGTGPQALVGMKELSVPFWRPFLNIPKQNLLEYAKKNDIAFREDVTNNATKYTRNKIRHRIIPEIENIYPGFKPRLARFGLDLAEMIEFLEKHLIKDFLGALRPEGCYLDKFRALPDSVVAFLVLSLIKRCGGNTDFTSSSSQVDRDLLSQLVVNIKRTDLGEKYERILPNRGKITIQSEKLRITKDDIFNKSCRLEQNFRGLTRDSFSGLLEPGGCLETFWRNPPPSVKSEEMNKNGAILSITNKSRDKGSFVRVFLPKLKETINFKTGSSKKSRTKELLDLLQIATKSRKFTFFVQKNGNLLFFNQGNFFTPLDREKNDYCDLSICLRYL